MTDPAKIYDSILSTTDFTVTEDHLKLLRRAYVSWEDCEFGAPAIDCKRPYGNSDVLADIAEALEMPEAEAIMETGEISPELETAFTKLHAETAVVLQIALATGEFRPGHYVRSRYGNDWHRQD